MKKRIYKQLQNSLVLASALTLLAACGSGGSNDEEDGNGAAGIIASDKAIASIAEASGICYSTTRDSLFVVSDRGILYELDTAGKELNKKTYKTSKGKKYDFEGVACDDASGNVAVAVEGKDNIMTINQSTLEKVPDTGDILRPADNTLYKDKDGKNGIEGITYHNGKVFISNQSNNTYPNKDASFIFTLTPSYKAVQPTIDSIIDPKLLDMSGLSFYHDTLYIIHQRDKLTSFDLTNQQVIKTITLPDGIKAEGVAFDNSGHIYFAYDNKTNGKVYKYSLSALGIE